MRDPKGQYFREENTARKPPMRTSERMQWGEGGCSVYEIKEGDCTENGRQGRRRRAVF